MLLHALLGCALGSVVELLAARDLAAGDEVLLSYGDRPLRDFLRGYAFLPHIPHEVLPPPCSSSGWPWDLLQMPKVQLP